MQRRLAGLLAGGASRAAHTLDLQEIVDSQLLCRPGPSDDLELPILGRNLHPSDHITGGSRSHGSDSQAQESHEAKAPGLVACISHCCPSKGAAMSVPTLSGARSGFHWESARAAAD